MFERFTDRARRVVVLAQEEARTLDHNYIGTEHLLLGLTHEEDGVAARALDSLGITLGDVRREVEQIIGRGREAPSGHIPFTPRAKKVLELSLREALEMGHNYIGTEHILLGLIREGEGVASQVLHELGGTPERVREAVLGLLSGSVAEATAGGTIAYETGGAGKPHAAEPAEGPEPLEGAPASAEVTPEDFPTCPSCFAVLRDTLRIRTLDIKAGDEVRSVEIAYCDRCGSAIGTPT